MQAIILAGGFGIRLQTIVSDVPKPMADISGKPFLGYLLTNLSITKHYTSLVGNSWVCGLRLSRTDVSKIETMPKLSNISRQMQ